MNITLKRLGCSEDQLNTWKKKGFSYDKKTAKQMIQAYNKVPGASLSLIDEFESAYDTRLPDDYKSFIFEYDGGVPVPAAFDIEEENNASVVKEFFGLDTPLTTSSLHYNIKLYENRIPSSFIPIGSDVFGNKIILKIEGDDFGSIFFWDHENESQDTDNKPSFDNIFLLSKSFSGFLKILRPSQE